MVRGAVAKLLGAHQVHAIETKLFKNGLNKICGIHPLKSLNCCDLLKQTIFFNSYIP